jgi:hypothetical protein
VGQGISVVPPSGWTVNRIAANEVNISFQGSALFRVGTIPSVGSASSEAVVSAILQQLANVITNISADRPSAISPPKSNVASAASATFQGTLAGQQGSTAVEGEALAFVRTDEVSVVIFTVNPSGDTGTYAASYRAMLSSILDTF